MTLKTKDFLANFTPELLVQSPGRINLIGEHTDYNQGFVLPTAINKHIAFRLAQNDSEHICRVYSKTFDSYFEIDLDDISISQTHWENYILGVVYEIKNRNHLLRGFDCVIESELPVGSGISSSAALECGLASGLNELFNLEISEIDIVFLCQKAEHDFVGTKCGIMDQYASVMSRAGKVILLDCKTQQHRYINATFDPYKIVLLNTNVSHKLADSEYNTRREECEKVVAFLQQYQDQIASLRDVSFVLLENYKNDIPYTLVERSSFVIEENNRVLTAAGALEEGALAKFGELMYASHKGLRHKYEVSCKELDFMVDFSRDYQEVIGSRMMGGGFGGCTINLIHKDKVDTYIKEIGSSYKETFGIDLTAFVATPSEGTQIHRL